MKTTLLQDIYNNDCIKYNTRTLTDKLDLLHQSYQEMIKNGIVGNFPAISLNPEYRSMTCSTFELPYTLNLDGIKSFTALGDEVYIDGYTKMYENSSILATEFNFINIKDIYTLIEDTFSLASSTQETIIGALYIEDLNKDEPINLLHPLRAYILLQKPDTLLCKGTLYLYIAKLEDIQNYRPQSATENIKKDTQNSILDQIYLYNNLVKDKQNIRINSSIDLINTDPEELDVFMIFTSADARSFAPRFYKHATQDMKYTIPYLSINEVLNLGLIIPYYGASIINVEYIGSEFNRLKGYSITPLTTANINPGNGMVCTGTLSKYTYIGVNSLRHVNGLSTYHKKYITKDYVDIVNENILFCRTLIKETINV
ncbi:hypothetical protein [Campylobacter hyointestinalis]|uniref:hypothetical protein n=1 Tax=Campylobacter hyointestinalis TaxID=198 RepID=UPI00072A13BC|nr:hypothetical protein [Campylobacter hyointestinalis]CUU91964.1 Uncharacterised protein [Campylobacter hyointestinalis subsp. hyointestinalis]